MKRILFGACLVVTAVGLWGCEEFTGCVENFCDGNIANLCIGGVVKTKDCGRAGCNKWTGKCKELCANGECTTCVQNFCNGSALNICNGGKVVLTKDCGLAGCNPLIGACNASPCTMNACIGGNVSKLCIDGVFVEKDCGSYGCNPLTGMCENYVEEGGNVGDACNRDVYKQTCINGGANALVCWNDNVAQWNCKDSQCQDAGYDASKPLQVNCPKDTSGSGGGSDLTEGGNVGDACNRNVYKQTCINGGANALVCWNDKVTQWNCKDSQCQDAGYDPAKPLQVNCKKGTTECTNTLANPNNDPTVEGASCDASTYHGACSSDFTKRYYCDKSGVVVQKDCPAGCDPCSLGNNGSKCKTSPGGSNLTEGGNVGDACDRNVYKQTCINGGANALVCWNDKVTQWNCKDSQCQDAGYDPAKPLQVKCPKTGGDYDGI